MNPLYVLYTYDETATPQCHAYVGSEAELLPLQAELQAADAKKPGFFVALTTMIVPAEAVPS